MTPLLTRLEHEIAQCTDPLRQAELLAERGCYLARVGDFAGARTIVASLRQTYGDGRYGRISVWTMLLEGLVMYFESVGAAARDRVFRANTVARAAGMPRLVGLTSVWCAHVDFECSAFSRMAEMLSAAIDLAGPEEHDTQSRLGIVLGDAYSYVGARSEAQYWYEHARRHATEIGDQAAVGAIMYNRPAFTLAALRVGYYIQGQSYDESMLRHIEMELRSAESFQNVTSVVSLLHLLDIAKARVAMCMGRFEEALSTFERIRDLPAQVEKRPNKSPVVADLLWCAHMSNRSEMVKSVLESVDPDSIDALHIDDKAIAASILSTVASGVADSTRAEIFGRIFVEAKRACSDEADQLRVALQNATERAGKMRGRFA